MPKPHFEYNGLLALYRYAAFRSVDLTLTQLLVLFLLWDNGTMTIDDVMEHLEVIDVDIFLSKIKPLGFQRRTGTKTPILSLVNCQIENNVITLSKVGKEMTSSVFGRNNNTRTS